MLADRAEARGGIGGFSLEDLMRLGLDDLVRLEIWAIAAESVIAPEV